VLRYEKGQHYGVHHDYGAEDVKLSCGPRILTFFLYLSGKLLFILYCSPVTQ
jgi:prolyl 4-hydroxylase